MPPFLYKLTNAAGGFWDSLDDRERQLLMYFGAYVIASAFIAWQHGSRERLKRELRTEMGLAHGRAR